ncbi:unnamed protein product [Ceutorhynchus assimilis]|uniref:Uncharacterized protein n=1 Tax=Ceutorhynchus assimilis TaxID=467358 RepID=A0A9N9MFG8_9CUCU|nr:unnamed protein product [Ceutorhynchus assimilis]
MDLAKELESLGGAHNIPDIFDCIVYDGAAFVHMIRLRNLKLFRQYFDMLCLMFRVYQFLIFQIAFSFKFCFASFTIERINIRMC